MRPPRIGRVALTVGLAAAASTAHGCVHYADDDHVIRTLTGEERVRARVFDHYWEELDERYPYFHIHGVDWHAMRRQYRLAAIGARDEFDFYRTLAAMLAELRDPHVQLIPHYLLRDARSQDEFLDVLFGFGYTWSPCRTVSRSGSLYVHTWPAGQEPRPPGRRAAGRKRSARTRFGRGRPGRSGDRASRACREHRAGRLPGRGCAAVAGRVALSTRADTRLVRAEKRGASRLPLQRVQNRTKKPSIGRCVDACR